MKKNLWLLCGLMVSTSLLAQQAPTSPAAPVETPAPAPAATVPATSSAPATTNAPAAKAAKKSAGKKKSGKKGAAVTKKAAAPRKAITPAALKTTPLTAGPAAVVANNVNVRGQASLKSEVIGHVTKGQTVTVIEEVILANSAPDEPSAWAKILLPAGIHTWINGAYIDPANKTVKATRLNLRSGPGENYSVLGRIEHGETVKDIGTKGDWMEIEAPTNAFAFVAAQFLKQEEPTAPTPTPAVASTTPTTTTPTAPETTTITPTTAAPSTTSTPTVAETKPTPTAPETTTVAANPTVTPPTTTENPTPAPAPVETPATNVTTAATAPAVEAPAPETKPEEPPPPRIVLREGIVRGMTSIQAPTHFELISPATGKTIDYLYTTSKDLDLRRFKGLRIVVAGEEGLDERWGNTPVLTIQKIDVLSEPPHFEVVPPASQR